MENQNIIVIPDAALFELGFSVGAGAVAGGFCSIGFYYGLAWLIEKAVDAYSRRAKA